MKKKYIGVFGLVMINLIAIDSLRNIPLTATAGISIVYFYVLGAVIFFIPCAVATAELSANFSDMGGISCWVEEAYGKDTSFFVVWMQWIYNLIWFPSITAFAATQLAYCYKFFYHTNALSLSNDAIYVTIVSLAVFWISTIISCFGIRPAEILSSIGAIVGTLLPMLLIVFLGFLWFFTGHAVNLTPAGSSVGDTGSVLGLMIVVLFSLMGLEMASAHAGAVKNPKRDFPRALLFTVILIPVTLILSNLSIDLVVPAAKIDPRAGLMQSFEVFFKSFNVSWMNIVLSTSLFLGAFAGIGAWAFGLSRYLRKIASNGFMPKRLAVTNKYFVPQNALIFQAVIVSIICCVYLWMPSIQSAYWFLSDLTAQLALIAYIAFFLSAIKLRLTRKWDKDSYTVGPKWLSITFYVLGIIGSLTGMTAGFILPGDSQQISLLAFDLMLLGGILLSLLIPFIVIKSKELKTR